MKKMLTAIAMALLLSSCATLAPYERRMGLLTRAPKPAIVVSVGTSNGSASVLIRDAKGHIFVVDDPSLATLKPGDVIR